MTTGGEPAHSASLPVLTRRELNRATLARQLLLARSTLGPIEAAGAVGGLQAQEPASPYIALWSRLDGFDPDAMSAAFADRSLVKGGLMRATLHAVPADDYLLVRPAVDPVFSVSSRLMRGVRPDAERLALLRAEVEAMAARPTSNTDLRDRVAALAGVDDDEGRDAVWWWVRRTTPLLQAPTGGPWSFGRRPAMVAPEAWLGRPLASRDEGLIHLARRYLGALGPATINDAASWSRLPVASLRPAFAALDAAGDLWHGVDEHGGALLDLVDAPRPPDDVEAPPRLLPMWDGLLLGHADRTRVIDPVHKSRIVAGNGDTYPTFLVDGRVAGLWWTRESAGGPEIELELFGRLAAADRAALEAEGAALAAFLRDREPSAYARYRSSRDRKVVARAATGTSD